MPEHASGARRKLARLVGREGGGREKEKEGEEEEKEEKEEEEEKERRRRESWTTWGSKRAKFIVICSKSHNLSGFSQVNFG